MTESVVVYVATERSGDPRRWWRAAARLGVAAALLVTLGLRIGGDAFARGIDSVTVPVLIAAIALTALSTLCAAWRWRDVARQLGAPLPAGRAIVAYYRSQFLNSVLPGGVAGDAYRAIAHGRDVDDVARAARAVVWDRTVGQIVQAVFTIAVLAIMPSPGRRLIPVLMIIVISALGAAWYISRGRRRGSSWLARVAGVVRSDLREVMRWPVWARLVIASLCVVVSHVALFVLVARTVDPTAPVHALVPLAVIVLIAAGIPVSMAGWGVREGAAAWVFAAAGLGAAVGVAAAAAYGIASLIAVLPGAVVLAMDLMRQRRPSRDREGTSASPIRQKVVVHG